MTPVRRRRRELSSYRRTQIWVGLVVEAREPQCSSNTFGLELRRCSSNRRVNKQDKSQKSRDIHILCSSWLYFWVFRLQNSWKIIKKPRCEIYHRKIRSKILFIQGCTTWPCRFKHINSAAGFGVAKGFTGDEGIINIAEEGTRARRCRSLNERVAMNPRVARFLIFYGRNLRKGRRGIHSPNCIL